MLWPPPRSTLFPYTTLFRSEVYQVAREFRKSMYQVNRRLPSFEKFELGSQIRRAAVSNRSEEHTSELQSPYDLVCRLLLEKKNRSASLAPRWILSRTP